MYTDKFNLFVIELKHTDLATAEDRAFEVDIWAKLFKATTWEEIKMITKDNPSMSSTAESIYTYNTDENIRELCRRREDAIAHENYQKKRIKDLTEEIASLSSKNASLSSKNASLSSENISLLTKIDYLQGLLAENNIEF